MRFRKVLFAISAMVAVLPGLALAFDRPFPANAKRGYVTPAPWPEIIIDGASRTLAPGARIWNQGNLIEMPSSLRGSGLAANYTEDVQGQIDRIWLLTPEEASQRLSK